MPRIHLVDSSPYIFRAYFSIPRSVTGPDGQPVNAVRGFGGFLLKLIEGDAVSHMALAFDRSLTTSFRNEIYPAYKAQRELPPEQLEAQLDACERLGQALGIATFEHERYEADDLIGSLCASLREGGSVGGEPLEVVIVTSDKDLAQLVTEGVSLYDFAKEERYGPAEVKARFGVEPGQIVDYLALAGDSVDNIPGVPGVGAKTAAALLEHFSGLDALYQGLDRVAELPIRGAKSLGRKLEENRDEAELSKQLATIVTDHDPGVGLGELELRGPDAERLESLARELGLGSFAERARKLFAER